MTIGTLSPGIGSPPTLEMLQETLRGTLAAAAGPAGFARLAPLGGPAQVADATTKALVLDSAGGRACVLICSSPVAPGQVARGVTNAREARRLLAGEARDVILEPLGEGEVRGLSYVLLPCCPALASGRLSWMLQRRSLTPRLLEWLHAVASTPTGDGRADGAAFEAALSVCASHPALNQSVHRDARRALDRLRSGEWKPLHHLDHNDLWKDNILLPAPARAASPGRFPFTVIDWVGANTRGYGAYDLVRFARSMRLRPRVCRRELRRHADALGCAPVDLMGHLLASFGWLGEHLEAFPVDRYAKSVQQCTEWLHAHVKELA
jgi:hypothetical protein